MKTLKPAENFASQLMDLPVFSSLDREDRNALLRDARLVSCEPGEHFFREREMTDGFFLLKAGRVKVGRTSQSGHEVILHICTPPQMFGCKGLTQPGSRYPANAVAIEPSIALKFSRKRFLEGVADNPEVFFKLLVDLNQRMSELFEIQAAVQEPVAQRIATFLLRQALPKYASLEKWNKVDLKDVFLTKRLIGAMVGTTTETTIRVLSKWNKQGLIRSRRGRITIVDPSQIANLAGVPLSEPF